MVPNYRYIFWRSVRSACRLAVAEFAIPWLLWWLIKPIRRIVVVLMWIRFLSKFIRFLHRWMIEGYGGRLIYLLDQLIGDSRSSTE